MNLEKNIPSLKDITFLRAIQANGLIVVLVSRGDTRRLRPVIRKIQRLAGGELDTEIRLVEESRNPQHILRDLIRPVRILGINTIWLPDNSFERKVRISSRDKSRIPLDIARLEEIVYELSGERIRIAID
jgi:transcription antitermination factor NusA-like protein